MNFQSCGTPSSRPTCGNGNNPRPATQHGFDPNTLPNMMSPVAQQNPYGYNYRYTHCECQVNQGGGGMATATPSSSSSSQLQNQMQQRMTCGSSANTSTAAPMAPTPAQAEDYTRQCITYYRAQGQHLLADILEQQMNQSHNGGGGGGSHNGSVAGPLGVDNASASTSSTSGQNVGGGVQPLEEGIAMIREEMLRLKQQVEVLQAQVNKLILKDGASPIDGGGDAKPAPADGDILGKSELNGMEVLLCAGDSGNRQLNVSFGGQIGTMQEEGETPSFQPQSTERIDAITPGPNYGPNYGAVQWEGQYQCHCRCCRVCGGDFQQSPL